ncbi:innexin inx2-like [Copidosoma floridanum]|uniref:innexin inx2-like n=1 Tax=Copidosoma floridanum TaxID=29053 RepID=UPI0006C96477|nr:innexin inx2-like [Copidosoma floridanum]
MFKTFDPVKSLLTLDDVCIDNIVFKLHYKATFVLLMSFSILVSATQYFGDPINCLADVIPPKIMNTYCWIHSTFTLPEKNGIPGRSVVQPGVSIHVEDSDQVKLHKNYQWVCFALFCQALLFYVPRYLWLISEGGKIKMLMAFSNKPYTSDKDKAKNNKLLVDYFIANLHSHNLYAYRFFVCEILNFLNVFLQMYAVDVFLGGEFSRYGLEVINFTEMDQYERIDPMTRVFPKLTKCTFPKYGPSGSVEKHDGLCVLALNVVNEKVYVFLWFWLWFLAAVSAVNLLYRVCACTGVNFRRQIFRARSRLNAKREVDEVFNGCRIGDWFVLSQFSKNAEPLTYKHLITDLVKEMQAGEFV